MNPMGAAYVLLTALSGNSCTFRDFWEINGARAQNQRFAKKEGRQAVLGGYTLKNFYVAEVKLYHC
jgi:hypothetical protein